MCLRIASGHPPYLTHCNHSLIFKSSFSCVASAKTCSHQWRRQEIFPGVAEFIKEKTMYYKIAKENKLIRSSATLGRRNCEAAVVLGCTTRPEPASAGVATREDVRYEAAR